jgi:hypothetical protein
VNLRLRLARWLDPDREYDKFAFGLARPFDHRIAAELGRIATTLEHLDRDAHQRRTRIVLCRHPELHPDDPAAVAVAHEPTDC